jgi:integrase
MTLAGQTETFGSQSAIWIQELEARKNEPISPSTSDTYRTHINRLLALIPSETPLSEIHNGFVRDLVAKMGSLAPKTAKETLATLRAIVASPLDPFTLDQIYPRVWNHKAIGARRVKNQKQPTMSYEQVEDAIKGAASWQEKLLYAILGGSALRISECRAIRVGPIDGDDQTAWLADQSLIKVRSTIFKNQELLGRVKTLAAKRYVDLPANLNHAIQKFVSINSIQPGQFLFQTQGKIVSATVLRVRAKKRGVPGFHSLRRFRISHLRTVPVLEDLTMYWAGHEGKTITDLYAKLGENIALRKQWATRAGLGFSLDKVGPAPTPKRGAQRRKIAVESPSPAAETVCTNQDDNVRIDARTPATYIYPYIQAEAPQIDNADKLDPWFGTGTKAAWARTVGSIAR